MNVQVEFRPFVSQMERLPMAPSEWRRKEGLLSKMMLGRGQAKHQQKQLTAILLTTAGVHTFLLMAAAHLPRARQQACCSTI